jgi:hypothetical protein
LGHRQGTETAQVQRVENAGIAAIRGRAVGHSFRYGRDLSAWQLAVTQQGRISQRCARILWLRTTHDRHD